jgi:hypothetical protein
MLNGCGFDVNDIPDLIKLAKETGRVQSGLADPPEYFESMDHFEPIFRELEPPELLYMPMRLCRLIQKHKIIFARNLRL